MATFDCSVCGLTFTSKSGRSNHVRSVHQDTAKVNFKRGEIQQSVEITRNQGNFSCPYCTYSNVWAGNVGRHLKTCANVPNQTAEDQAANADVGDEEIIPMNPEMNDRVQNNVHIVTAELIGLILYSNL